MFHIPPPTFTLPATSTLSQTWPVTIRSYNLSVSPEKEISLLFHLETVKMWREASYLNWCNSGERRKWNKMRRISLFSAWSLIGLLFGFVQTAEINAAKAYLWQELQFSCDLTSDFQQFTCVNGMWQLLCGTHGLYFTGKIWFLDNKH